MPQLESPEPTHTLRDPDFACTSTGIRSATVFSLPPFHPVYFEIKKEGRKLVSPTRSHSTPLPHRELGSEMSPKSTHAATTPLPLSPASHSTFLLHRLSQIAASQQQMQNLTLAWNLANQNENSLHVGFFSHSTALTHANGK